MFNHHSLHGARHPITGVPVTPLGFRKNGRPIWPVMGGSQPAGEGPGPTAPPGPSPQPIPVPPGIPQPPMFPPPGMGPGQTAGQQPGQHSGQHPGQHPMTAHLPNNENGYPDHTPVASMNAEQQAAYWRTYARRNEDRIKQMGDYQQLKEQADAYSKLLAETQTEQQKAVAQAEARGRQSALAEAGSQMVEAYVRAAATGRMNDEQVSTLLQGLDRTRFVNPSTGQVDASMISAYVAMLAPAPTTPAGWPGAPAYPPPVPATGLQYPPNTTYSPTVPGVAGPGPVPQQLTYPPGAQQQYPQQYAQPGQQAAPPQWSVYPPPQQPPAAAPPAMGDGRQVPSYGQAQFGSAPASGFEAGKALARARFSTNKPAQQQ